MTTVPTYDASVQDEQRFFDVALDVREAKRQVRMRSHESTGDLKSASALKRNGAGRTLGEPEDSVAFKRIDTVDDVFYVGRHAIHDESGEILVYAWQAPAVMAFGERGADDPGDVVRFRDFATAPVNSIDSFSDRVLADIADRLESLSDDADRATLVLDADEMLRHTLDHERSPEMREIIQTIQAAQSKLIRYDPATLLVIQGGPGTGKTAVATHRVSWLLYNSPDLRPEDVLVVGPNKTFTRYIDKVLTDLGDSRVRRADLGGMLRSAVSVTRKDRPETARLKGESRMVEVLSRGILDRIKPPSQTIRLRVEGAPWRIDLATDTVARLLDDLRSEHYAQGRSKFREQLTSHVAVLIRRRFHDEKRHLPRDARLLIDASEIENIVASCWPQLSAQAFLRDLLGSRDRLLSAGGQELSAAEIQLLHRPSAPRLADERWSKEDAVLLDFIHHEMNGRPDSYQHIVVDEAQDLSPMQIVAVRNRSAHGAMTIVGDIAQSTGLWARSNWDEVVSDLQMTSTHAIEELTHGYRVPRKIMAIAAELLPTIAPGINPPTVVRDVTQEPRFISVPNVADLITTVVDQAQEAAKRGRFTGVICPDTHRAAIEAAFEARDVAFTNADNGSLGTSINMISPVAAKGLEFDAVVVADPQVIVDAGPQGLRMLYIAITRTTRELAVVYPSGTLPRELHGPRADEDATAARARENNPVSFPDDPRPLGRPLHPAESDVVRDQAGKLLAHLEMTTPHRLWGHTLIEALRRVNSHEDQEATAPAPDQREV